MPYDDVMRRAMKTGIFLCVIPPLLAAGCIFSSKEPKEKVVKDPRILSVSVSEGETIASSDLVISWTADGSATSFQYSLDGVLYPSTDTTSVTFCHLEEDGHVFTVQAARDTLLSEPYTVNFTIDAVVGPGILFAPRTVRSISFTTLYLEDVAGLMAAHIEIACVDASAWLTDFVPADDFSGDTDSVIFANQKDPQRLVIDIGFPGRPDGVSGRIALGSFLVRPLTGTGTVTVDSLRTIFRDTANNPIEIKGFDTIRIER